jgi:hypothetical protein
VLETREGVLHLRLQVVDHIERRVIEVLWPAIHDCSAHLVPLILVMRHESTAQAMMR